MYFDYDWANAGKHFRRAIELAPSSAEAHSRYAHYLLWVRGRFDEAVAEVRRAVELEPLSVSANTWLGAILMYVGRHEEAITQLRLAVELDPSQWHARHCLGIAYWLNSTYAEAIAAEQTAISLAGPHPWSLTILALAYAASGKAAEAEAIYDDLLARSRREYVQPMNFAIMDAALGRKDEALEWLDRAYDERDAILPILKYSGYFDSINDEPRFQDLLRRMDLLE
jgi:Flp pilus assembly protein TadD